MKKYFLTLLFGVVCLPLCAQNWTKELYKTFKKEKKVAVVVDLTNAKVMGVSLADFPDYYSGKYQANNKYASLVLEKFKNKFISEFYTSTKKEDVKDGDAAFSVVYKVAEITDKAGFSGKYYVIQDSNKSAEIDFKQKDGHWNEFENLLLENVTKFWRLRKAGNPGGNPYSDKIYKYKNE